MARKSKDSEEFDELKRMGMNFSSPDTSFQPDSSGTASGVIGAQEYGIIGEIATEDLSEDQVYALIDSIDTSDASLIPMDDIEGELTGASEWSAKHAIDPEDIVEKAEKFSNDEEEQKEKTKQKLKLVKK